MKRVLLYGMLLCTLVIGYVSAFPNEQQEQNVEDIRSISFNDTQDAGTGWRVFLGNEVRAVRGMPSGKSQSSASTARMMQNPQRAVQRPLLQDDQQQVFTDRSGSVANLFLY